VFLTSTTTSSGQPWSSTTNSKSMRPGRPLRPRPAPQLAPFPRPSPWGTEWRPACRTPYRWVGDRVPSDRSFISDLRQAFPGGCQRGNRRVPPGSCL
jgi:hypothetical protein